MRERRMGGSGGKDIVGARCDGHSVSATFRRPHDDDFLSCRIPDPHFDPHERSTGIRHRAFYPPLRRLCPGECAQDDEADGHNEESHSHSHGAIGSKLLYLQVAAIF
jgi:hypothetical protein